MPRLWVSALALLGVSAFASQARAQACCAGSGVLTPGRLNLHEDAAAGLQVKAVGLYGSYDGKGRFVASPSGATETDLEQDLLWTVRLFERGQLTGMLPFVETLRKVPGISEKGGGIGDLQLNGRWDFTLTGASTRVPGIGLLVGLTLPTGTAPERAEQALGTDATGTGAFQGALGLSLEQTFGKWLVNITGSGTIHARRTTTVGKVQEGLGLTGFVAVGYSWDNGLTVALTTSYLGQLPAKIDGVTEADTGRVQIRPTVAAGYTFNDAFRIQGNVFFDIPAAHAGQNENAGAGAAVTALRTF